MSHTTTSIASFKVQQSTIRLQAPTLIKIWAHYKRGKVSGKWTVTLQDHTWTIWDFQSTHASS